MKKFDSFVNEGKEDLFDILKGVLSGITFDSQSYRPKNSIYDELEKEKGVQKIKILLNRLIADKCTPSVASDILWEKIDVIIGTSRKQEKELRKVFIDFFTENIS